jgi:hypothetical protein
MFRSARLALSTAFTTLAVMTSPHALSHSDIEATVIGGKLTVNEENTAPIAFGTGYKIFEGDFGDLAGGPTGTDDPGFIASEGTFLSGEQLWYNALGTLSYWNGSNWGSAPGGTTLTIEEALGGSTLISSTGIMNSYGAVDAADATGGIHTHLDFSISNASPAGAYMATLELTSRDAAGNLPSPYLDSDPFHIVFNRGLSGDAFEASVTALASPVPEPETYAMFLAGLALCGAMASRCQRKTG